MFIAKYQRGSSFCLFGALELYPEGTSASPQSWFGMGKAGNVDICPGDAAWPLQCLTHRTLL